MNSIRRGLNRDSLSQQIAEDLIDRIHKGIYKPITRIPSENELASEYEVSRPVVREAIRMLSAQGIIKVIRGKGAIVQEVNEIPLKIFFQRALSADPKAWRDVIDVRKYLEVNSAGQAAIRRTEQDLEELRNIIDELNHNENKYEEYSDWDIKFHLKIAECSGNSLLHHFINAVRDSLFVIINRLRHNLDNNKRSLIQKNHENIYYAISEGDKEGAERAMEVHFNEIVPRIEEYENGEL
jgi:GntR family transcriptional regulator, transcriptional repressor for pyruvate dehydrogenase complex